MNRHPFRTRLVPLSLFIGALVAAPVAYAQDPEAELMEAEADLLAPGGLQEAKAPSPKVVSDPDPKLLEEVEAARQEMQTFINTFTQTAERFTKTDAAMQKLTAQVMKAVEVFIRDNRKAVAEFRSAEEAGNDKSREAARKSAIKARKDFLMALDKLKKERGKLEKEFEKIAAKAAAEDAEETDKDEE